MLFISSPTDLMCTYPTIFINKSATEFPGDNAPGGSRNPSSRSSKKFHDIKQKVDTASGHQPKVEHNVHVFKAPESFRSSHAD